MQLFIAQFFHLFLVIPDCLIRRQSCHQNKEVAQIPLQCTEVFTCQQNNREAAQIDALWWSSTAVHCVYCCVMFSC